MSSSLASTYDQKLKKWIKAMSSDIEAIPVAEQLLEDVIRRNNIVNIAAKVEVYQLMMEGVTLKLNAQLDHMRAFRKNLYEDDELIEDSAITKLIEQEMKVIGQQHTKIENEYQTVKTQCDMFLAETLKHKK